MLHDTIENERTKLRVLNATIDTKLPETCLQSNYHSALRETRIQMLSLTWFFFLVLFPVFYSSNDDHLPHRLKALL